MKVSVRARAGACLSCAIVLAFSSDAGFAAEEDQTTAGTQTLSRIKVEAKEEFTTEDSYTVESTATAIGLSLSVRDTPQSVSVVTRGRMDDQAMTTVADALRNTTGVSLKPVDRGRNNLSVRGFEVNNFQLDGVPVATGNIGLETTNTIIYDRIEVVRGATGLLSGAGDPSAAINLVRKRANSDAFVGSFKAEVGSWDRRTGTVDLGDALNRSGSVRARFIASANEQNSFVALENTNYTVFYGVIDADLGGATRLSVGASDQRDERNGVLWAGLPYWYSDGSRTDWSRSKTTATRWNRWDTKDQSVFATLSHRFSNQWTLRGDVVWHRRHEDSMMLWMWGDPDRVTGEGMAAYPYHYIADPEQIHADVVVSGFFDLFGREHELTGGLMHSKLDDAWTNRDAAGSMAPVGDFNAWDGSYPEPAMGERYVGSSGTTTQTGLYAAARLQLTDAFKFIGGARISNWKREEEEGAWTAHAYEIDHTNVLTPYAGLMYDLTGQISVYASYTDSFKPQAYRDSNDDYLDPVEGKSYEAGLKGEFIDGRLNAALALFRIDQENVAEPDVGQPLLPNGDRPYRAAQGVISEGYEFEVSGELATHWHLSLGWTHYSAKDADDVDVAFDHARELFRLFTKYTLPGRWHGLGLGGGITWEGDRPATATNPATGLVEKVGQPAYALVDLMAKYEFGEQLSLQLNLSNARDEKYRSGSHWWGSPLTYGAPRAAVLSVDYRF